MYATINTFDSMKTKKEEITTIQKWMYTVFNIKYDQLLLLPAFMQTEMFLKPNYIMKGSMVKMIPSTTRPITEIDLSLRLNHEMDHSGMSKIMPAMKVSARLIYSAKLKETPQKTWDVNVKLDMNNGHTDNTLKVHMTKIVPGKSDYKICMDGKEKYSPSDITRRLEVSMSESTEATCSKDDVIMKILSKSEKLPEQLSKNHHYKSCGMEVQSHVIGMKPLSCFIDHSSMGKQEIDIETHNMPSEFKRTILDTIEYFKQKFSYHHIETHGKTAVPEHHLKITLEQPIASDVVDVDMTLPSVKHEFMAVPADEFSKYRIFSKNLHYFSMLDVMHNMGLTVTCFVDYKHICDLRSRRIFGRIEDDWELIIGDSAVDTKYGLFMKTYNKKLVSKQRFSLLLLNRVFNFDYTKISQQ